MPDIPQGIIDSLVHPPLELLSFFPDLGNPYAGDVWIEVPQTAALVPEYFGLVIEVGTPPPNGGYEDGFNGGPLDLSFDRYIDWMWQAVEVHKSADGSEFGGKITYGNYARQLIVFDSIFAKALAVHVRPHLAVSLFWLAIT